ncbi:MAG: GNAT family N-acetyltransferase [Bacteroidota bacterium]
MLTFRPAQTDAELESILALQRANLASALDEVSLREEGFVTVEHDLDLLGKMNQPYGHMLALEAEKVQGYCLVMLASLADEIAVLRPMFEKIQGLHFKHQPLKEVSYFAMGQVCIAKAWRGKGMFVGMYQALAKQMSPDFELCITGISARNLRSLRAHAKLGFETLSVYEDPDGETWHLVAWPMPQSHLSNSL